MKRINFQTMDQDRSGPRVDFNNFEWSNIDVCACYLRDLIPFRK